MGVWHPHGWWNMIDESKDWLCNGNVILVEKWTLNKLLLADETVPIVETVPIEEISSEYIQKQGDRVWKE